MESINILYVVMVFVFLHEKYGLRDLNLIYFILLSVGIVRLVKIKQSL